MPRDPNLSIARQPDLSYTIDRTAGGLGAFSRIIGQQVTGQGSPYNSSGASGSASSTTWVVKELLTEHTKVIPGTLDMRGKGCLSLCYSQGQVSS